MLRMFNECNELENLDVSSFDTSKVMNMEVFFCKCYKLKEIKGLNKLKTNNVTNMDGMFQSLINIESLDLSNFDTSNVKSMKGMFNKCYKLKEIKGLSKFNTKNVIDMSAMFQLCGELEYLDLSSFDTSNVIHMDFMFTRCSKLKEIKGINKFNTKNLQSLVLIFDRCEVLEYSSYSDFFNNNFFKMFKIPTNIKMYKYDNN